MSELRIGLGLDAHAFAEGIPLVLGGVRVDHPAGLAGHSDGDVIAHALTDALLGAAGLGDIGSLFPPDDPRWEGADSLELLRDAYGRVRAAGYELALAWQLRRGHDQLAVGRLPGPPRNGAGLLALKLAGLRVPERVSRRLRGRG